MQITIVKRTVGKEEFMAPTKIEEAEIDVGKLAQLLRETEEHHGQYEKTHGKHNWWEWYAPYLSARLNGKTPDEGATAAARYMEKK